jgi:S-(hydroxymethyl)glutathione dehydrogenase/alcohol dehydrogenase
LGTFADYTVVRADALAKVREDANLDTICYVGCGATTGLGAALFAAKIQPDSSVVVFGLGGLGLNVVQGAKLAGARQIIGVDINPAKEAIARRLGATDFINPTAIDRLTSYLIKLTSGGADYSFECIGLPHVMGTALECTNPAWGVSYALGIAPHGAEMATTPGTVFMGRRWTGCYMGGAQVSQLSQIVDWYVDKRIELDSMITHKLPLEKIGDGFELMKRGEAIRTVIVL